MTRHPAIAFVLAAVLALTSATLAVARTAPPGLTLTLCTAEGKVTLTVDSRGQPVAPRHPCPDCTAALALGTPPAPPQVVVALGRPEAMPPAARQDIPARPAPVPAARGPPSP